METLGHNLAQAGGPEGQSCHHLSVSAEEHITYSHWIETNRTSITPEVCNATPSNTRLLSVHGDISIKHYYINPKEVYIFNKSFNGDEL